MSQPGELYEAGTPFGPDPRFSADLAAIDEYVRNEARARLSQYPNSKSLIEDYERWRQGLGVLDLYWYPNDTMNLAKRKRDAINAAQGNVTPADRNVELGSFITSPPDTSLTRWDTVRTVAIWGGVGLGALLLLRYAPALVGFGNRSDRGSGRRSQLRGKKGQKT